MFRDRTQAGQKLAQELAKRFPRLKDGIVLGLPRGGVVVAAEVSQKLNLPLDIIVVRKIGAPGNPEYAVAACSEHELIINPHENPDPGYLKEASQKERQEIQRRLQEYRGGKLKLDLEGKMVFIIDDGLATGLTMEVAIHEIRQQNPAKIILAVPVAPPETIERLKPLIDESLVLEIEPSFFAVGQFYENFPQVVDEEVKKLL